MSDVEVTVLMPVYNGAKYIAEAIDSILNQTFKRFELLIINDSSTDASTKIIQRYHDHRIRLVVNQHNLGLIATLNLGIQQATGQYLARMDQDDIADPERLAVQVQYLNHRPHCALVASTVTLMNNRGINTGQWAEDIEHISAQDISAYLVKANCLAHPSVMGRTSVFKKYQYSRNQTAAEDYDLWLRLAADNLPIEKIARPLLRYRIHAASMTQQSQQHSGPGKNTGVKGRFLKQQLRLGKVNGYYIQVAWRYCLEILRWLGFSIIYTLYRLAKKIIRTVGYYIGAGLSRWYVLDNPGGYYFFFHTYGVGGAELVHAQVVETVRDKKPLIIFTTPTQTPKTFLDLYTQAGTVLNLVKPLSSIFGYAIYLGIIAHNINTQPHPVVFGAVSAFFYELLPLLQPHVQTIGLTHAFDAAGERWFVQFVPYLKHRIAITQTVYHDLLDQYAAYKLPADYKNRLLVIANGVEIPLRYQAPTVSPSLQVVYLGRGTYEKRLHLIGEIAQRCHSNNSHVQFTCIGDIPEAIIEKYQAYCTFKKEVTDPTAKAALFKTAHILIMTSSREGFPLSIMEAMAHGVVPLVTNVGGIADHITHQQTGLLVDNISETHVIETMVKLLTDYSQRPNDLEKISRNSYEYAVQHFSLERFKTQYQKLFQSLYDYY